MKCKDGDEGKMCAVLTARMLNKMAFDICAFELAYPLCSVILSSIFNIFHFLDSIRIMYCAFLIYISSISHHPLLLLSLSFPPFDRN